MFTKPAFRTSPPKGRRCSETRRPAMQVRNLEAWCFRASLDRDVLLARGRERRVAMVLRTGFGEGAARVSNPDFAANRLSGSVPLGYGRDGMSERNDVRKRIERASASEEGRGISLP